MRDRKDTGHAGDGRVRAEAGPSSRRRPGRQGRGSPEPQGVPGAGAEVAAKSGRDSGDTGCQPRQ